MNSSNKYPLSPLQYGMLYHYLSDKFLGVDIDQIVCHLRENLDVNKIQKAWEKVIKVHSVCRTSFSWEGLEEPVQKIHDQVKLPLEIKDWSDLSESEIENKLKIFLENDRAKGFELDKPPLMRISIIKVSRDEFYCIWTFQHILLDGRSHFIILNDVFSTYDSLCNGIDYKINETASYQNFIKWLLKKDHSKSESFWSSYLKAFTTPTKLNLKPPAGILNNKSNINPDEEEILVDDETTSKLRDFAELNQITFNTIIQGAWSR
jgi:NRPS condensation-like uncharacterized protein